ncbi:MAG: SAM-dependent methyltransferase [Microcoleaceae cyanobacterium]
MGLQLKTVIPWGRSKDEYTRMFGLSPEDLTRSMLDCAGGPASFNAEMTEEGYSIISCDPAYQFSAEEINQRIQDTYEIVISGVRANLDRYIWQDIQSPEHLGEIRIAAMQKFLQDFPQGFIDGRYRTAELPKLPFQTHQFDLALCGHFLFTYSELLSEQFHLESILELCRVAQEVRIFPVLTLSGELSPFLALILDQLSQRGYQLSLQTVPYEFQVGGNQMLQILR